MRSRYFSLLLLTSCATVSSSTSTSPESASAKTSPQAAAPARVWRQERAVVVRHATVMPASGPAIEDGAVAFVDGKILAVGRNADVATPPGAEEVDGTGLYVTPGIIDAHSHLGVYASPDTTSTSDGNEATAPVTAEISAEHSFWPQDPGLRRAAAGGITSLLVLPGSANLIGGRGYPVKLHFGRSAAEMRFPGAKDGLKMACGENPRRVYGTQRRAPATRMANVAGYRQAFAKAREYMQRHEEWEKKRAKKPEEAGPAPLRDLQLETLAEVMRGNILVQNHCYRADEMEVMLRVADEFGYSIRAFHHALEAYKLRDRLAEKQVAVATWADWWGFKMEAWDGIPENAGLVSQAGGRAVIHSDSALGIQRLNQEAGKALWRARESGIPLTEEEALRWVTLHPAWTMGVEDRTGSLEPGKMADVVLWKHHPLSVYARAQRVWADGVVTYDAALGAVDASDFELGERAGASARLVAQPAAPPALQEAGLGTRCEPSADNGCARPLEVTEAACTAFQDVAVLSNGTWVAHASVLVENGKVTRVQPGVLGAVPAGCRSVEGKGRVLAPGFVDALTSLGVVEVGLEESTVDDTPRGEEAKDPIRAAQRAADSLNPASETFPVARLGGVTAAGVIPTGGLVSGLSAWVTTDGTVRRAPLALHINLGLTGRNAVSGSRSQVLERLRELLTDAREYNKRKGDFEQNRMRTLAASRLDLEALQPALAGTVPVVVTANRVSDIRAALGLGREFGLKVLIAGGREAWMVARELAAAKVPVIVQPTQNLPSSFDGLSSRLDAAALLSAAGVKVLFSTQGEPHMVRTLAQEAGNAVAWGLPYADAVRAITSNVTEAFGLEGGQVAPGQVADLVLWNGDPLEVSSRPLGMWLGGKQVPLTTRQQALFEKYRALPK
ncbi:amidohydrolase family protein [Archangium sp.]|uniref:amidohydrolase family protein n=1 Tax=Archangium sp. TaxID=1872627 RepID=UPI00286CE853|nr:amidohydrolase family protein [Archangium sp.]